ncbi:MAG TPA: lysylphosphatidylglycerol synthase transmembrane domain-containing protein, partial [Anaerolineales bacterium]|nr:lysylphosphatidylglycerol synthase transmembrane domain-containing protein [Anaerolineales bacterium]
GVRQIPPLYFVLSIVVMLASRTAVALRWHALLRSGGVKATVGQSLKITYAGLFASNFLPTTIGGDVVRLAMALRAGFDKVISTASLVVDRLVGMAGMGSAAPLGLPPILSAMPASQVLGPSMAAIPWAQPWIDRAKGAVGKLWQATVLWIRSPRGLLLAFGLTWVHQICIFTINWLLFRGMGEPISFWLAGGLWSFTYFVTLIPISIGGLGLQELSMTYIFSHFGGVSAHSAAIVALLVRTLQTLASVPGVAFLPEILSGRRMKIEENG